jgi:OOP family OmpA-OmpF porin
MRLKSAFAVLIASALIAGCAHPPIPIDKTTCVVAGAVIGGAAGPIIRHQSDGNDETDEKLAAGGIGAAAGATLGYLLCGVEEAKPAPPPPPAPRAEPPPPTPKRIVLRGVNFDFDKADIRPDAEVILNEAADVLGQNRDVRVQVAGHTDATGTDEYNQSLSERRANSVADYLASKGIDRSRLSTVGYGESQPVADNGTRDGRAQNRRVELNVQQ